MRIDVRIIERANGRVAPGVIRPAVSSDKVLWTHWHGLMPAGEEDAHWEWDRLMDLSFTLPGRFAVYSLEAEGELQGLRILEVSDDEVDAYGVHALRLSTAPWNREPALRFRGVGSLLVGVSILRSLTDGRQGCIHCESLPGAEAFHKKNRMIAFDGLSAEGLRRYRFTSEEGQAFLNRLRSEGLIPWPT